MGFGFWGLGFGGMIWSMRLGMYCISRDMGVGVSVGVVCWYIYATHNIGERRSVFNPILLFPLT